MAVYWDVNRYGFNQEHDPENELKAELLWENASPTSAFLPQSVSIDIDKYKYLEIYALYTRTANAFAVTCKLPCVSGYSSYIDSYSKSTLKVRTFAIGTNKIDFSEGNSTPITNINFVENNDSCIPFRIVGYR